MFCLDSLNGTGGFVDAKSHWDRIYASKNTDEAAVVSKVNVVVSYIGMCGLP